MSLIRIKYYRSLIFLGFIRLRLRVLLLRLCRFLCLIINYLNWVACLLLLLFTFLLFTLVNLIVAIHHRILSSHSTDKHVQVLIVLINFNMRSLHQMRRQLFDFFLHFIIVLDKVLLALFRYCRCRLLISIICRLLLIDVSRIDKIDLIKSHITMKVLVLIVRQT